jgi:hypothetical protein
MTPEDRDAANEQRRERYKRLKAAGICTKCGHREALAGHVLCFECQLKARKMQTTIRRRKGILPREGADVCSFCGAPVMPGKKVCAKHYEWLKKQAAMMREKGGHSKQAEGVDAFWRLHKAGRAGKGNLHERHA